MDGDEIWAKQTTLYPRKSQIPSKPKTVAFNYDKDILFKIEYDEESVAETGKIKKYLVYCVIVIN